MFASVSDVRYDGLDRPGGVLNAQILKGLLW